MSRDPQPYVNLARAILQQAMSDAYATHTTPHTDRLTPTPTDVADARAFLEAPAALELVANLGLHPGYARRILQANPPGDMPRPSSGGGWLNVEEAAARFGYSRERVRWLIRAGRIRAAKGRDGWAWRINPESLAAYREGE
jgi:excisionase family DNA binding protein